MQTEAWRTLPHAARSLLIELYALYNGLNNGELFLSIREAAKRLAIATGTAQRMFGQLEQRGFIRVRQKGSFHFKSGNATSWVLTEFEYAGQAPSKDFMRWKRAEIQKPVSMVDTDGANGCYRGRPDTT